MSSEAMPEVMQEERKLTNSQAEKERSGEKLREQPDEPDKYRLREYAWLKEHRHEYPGEYIVIEGDRLYAHGKDGRKALAEARQAGAKWPIVIRVEAADEGPFCGGW